MTHDLELLLKPVTVGQRVYYEQTGERLAFVEAITAISQATGVSRADLQARVDQEFQRVLDI